MLARKCERCGNLYECYEKYEKGEEQFNGIMKVDMDMKNCYSNMGEIDLCPECKQSFLKWLYAPLEEKEKNSKT